MLREILSRPNMLEAYDRVVSNQGAPGVDGMDVASLHDHIKHNWISIRNRIETGTYIPALVKKVEIPKPNGGGGPYAWHTHRH